MFCYLLSLHLYYLYFVKVLYPSLLGALLDEDLCMYVGYGTYLCTIKQVLSAVNLLTVVTCESIICFY